ncbi:MAG: MOSC domain-containing protein [Trueperaceae bacterium]
MMHLSQIWTYPVKSCAGVSTHKAVLNKRGLVYDRHWMVVNLAGKMMTLREAPELVRVQPQFASNHLKLTAPKMPLLELPYQSMGREQQVKLWEGWAKATALADGSTWFSEYLRQEVLLVAVAENNTRTTDSDCGTRALSFVDNSPLNLLGKASLDDLNRRLEKPANIEQFRPNLVFAGGVAYAEDSWQHLCIGTVLFDVCGPCARCMVVNVSADGSYAKAPLATLASYRRSGKRVLFGQDLVHRELGELQVGDKLGVIRDTDLGVHGL